MEPLVLTFRDAGGEPQKVSVERPVFVIGRHSECDLCIPDGRLSREHVRIERDEDGYTVADLGSSNGSKLNGEILSGVRALSPGDDLELGGAIVINVEDPSAAEASAAAIDEPIADTPDNVPMPATIAPTPTSGGIPMAVFIIGPLAALVLLVVVIGGFFLLRGKRPTESRDSNEFVYTKGDDLDDKPERTSKSSTPETGDKVPDVTPGSGSNTSVSNGSSAATNSSADLPPSDQSDAAKVERSGAAFLRRIAANDTKAFLTSEQSNRVSAKVKQLSKNSALADNINSAKKNSAAIASLAKSKNLTPQFLAVAALTKLGSGRGDALQAAQSVADIFDKLATQIGNERADDSLLMVSAYDQGSAGDFMKMRNMLQDLSNKYPESSRAIRTIWFLEKNSKISASEFDLAINFLALGTITQNPKDFGVNAEPLVL